MKVSNKSTSWEGVDTWYSGLVGEEGHYYHQHLILPNVLRLMGLKKTPNPTVLDLACGQGVLGRHLAAEIPYLGVDLSSSFIREAQKMDSSPHHRYLHADITKAFQAEENYFSHATVILALQNVEHPLNVFQNAYRLLRKEGSLLIVMNHPCFRIPRQSSWQVDQEKKWQYRRVDRYFSPMKIPIHTHPGKGKDSSQTWSFHHPLSSYFLWLQQSKFMVEVLEEWCSNKASVGKHAKMENHARAEFPLFLTIKAKRSV